jgi:hypothetical protein
LKPIPIAKPMPIVREHFTTTAPVREHDALDSAFGAVTLGSVIGGHPSNQVEGHASTSSATQYHHRCLQHEYDVLPSAVRHISRRG